MKTFRQIAEARRNVAIKKKVLSKKGNDTLYYYTQIDYDAITFCVNGEPSFTIDIMGANKARVMKEIPSKYVKKFGDDIYDHLHDLSG